MTEITIPLFVLLPLVAAALCAAIPIRKFCIAVTLLISLLQFVLASKLLVFFHQTDTHDGIIYSLGGWNAPLGINIYVDGLACALLFVCALLTIFLSIYSFAYFQDDKTTKRFWPLWWLLIAGLNGVFVSSDAFNIYVTLEIIGLSAAALTAINNDSNAVKAALRYLLIGLFGSMSYLLGVALLYRSFGTLDLLQLGSMAQETQQNAMLCIIALGLISAGLILKSALLPMHFWLPPAHANAPAPVSAVLSALVIKASFYLLVRFHLDVLPEFSGNIIRQAFGVLGAFAIIYGSLQALRAKRLKLIVAYSTVAQLGYLFLLFPLLNETETYMNSGPVAAVAYFLVAHACAKSAMFMAAGSIMKAATHDELPRLTGIVRNMPLSLFAFAIAGASIIGLPPSAGFIGKWLLLNSAFQSGQWWWILIILLGGLLAAAYVFRVLNLAFKEPEKMNNEPICKFNVSRLMSFSALALAALTLAMGFNSLWLTNLIQISRGAVG